MHNAQRSMRFEVAIMSLSDEYEDDIRTTLVDLLADARHWCDRNDESFADLDQMAYQHYLAELDEEQTQERKAP